jgi:hypothetical protein
LNFSRDGRHILLRRKEPDGEDDKTGKLVFSYAIYDVEQREYFNLPMPQSYEGEDYYSSEHDRELGSEFSRDGRYVAVKLNAALVAWSLESRTTILEKRYSQDSARQGSPWLTFDPVETDILYVAGESLSHEEIDLRRRLGTEDTSTEAAAAMWQGDITRRDLMGGPLSGTIILNCESGPSR